MSQEQDTPKPGTVAQRRAELEHQAQSVLGVSKEKEKKWSVKTGFKKLFGLKEKGCDQDAAEEIRFLLVGKTGCGKSTTGNTILGEDKFNAGLNFSSVTVDCDLQRSQSNGMNIEVLDCPGLCDTDKSEVEVCTIIVQAIGGLHPGPHAVLFIVKLGRFTEEEYTVFKRLKELLDENVTKYMIVVFTGGDALEKEKKTLADLLTKAPKSLTDVLNQVDNKCIVFNNNAKNPRPQVNQLIDMVRVIIKENNGVAYSCPKYALISEGMEKEIAKRLKEVEMRDLEQRNLVSELEAKAKEAEEQILRLREELAKKESDLESKIQVEKETQQRENEELLRKLESQKHKEENEEVQGIKHQLEMERMQKEIDMKLILKLQNQHEEERQQIQKEKETLERQIRENEEIRQKKKEEEEKLEAQRQEVYEAELRKMRDEISRKENEGFFSSALSGLKNSFSRLTGWFRS